MRAGAPVRVGLVGCGAIASAVHLPVLRRLRAARLVAVADPDPEARRRAARARGVEVGESAAWLIGRGDLDAVVVCAPSGDHAEVAVAAAEAGLHAYVEKPLATSLPDALRVVRATAAAGTVTCVGFNRRLHPLHRRARELLRAGAVGRVRSVACAFGEPIATGDMPGWKLRRATGGGVLLDLATHHVDLVRWLLDAEVVEVEASLASEASEDDTAHLGLGMSDGTAVEGTFSFRAERADRLDVTGDLGTLRIDRYGWALRLTAGSRGGRPRRLPPPWQPTGWRLRRLAGPSNDPSWRYALEAFLGHVRGTPSELADAVDGLRCLEIVLAAEESARRSAPVTPGGDSTPTGR